jgi:hypothetical protein
MPERAFYKELKKKLQIWAGLLLLNGHLLAAEPAKPADEPLFYRVAIDGAPAGRMKVTESRTPELLTTAVEFELVFQRAGLTQSLGMASRFVESADGQPVEAWSLQRLGGSPIETTYRFAADGVEVETRQGDNSFRRKVPKAAGWQPPAAAEEAANRAIAAALAGGPSSFSVTSVDPLLGPEPATTVWELEAKNEEIEAGGRRFATSRWRQTQSMAPQVPSIVWLDAGGEVRRTATEMAGMAMLIEWTASQPLLPGEGAGAAANEGPAGVAAPEVMTQTFLRPDRPLPSPRSLERAVYELKGEDLDLPELGYQRVAKIDGGLRLTVDLAAAREESLGAAELAPYLGASIFVNHENGNVRKLHRRALEGVPADAAPAARAELLRRFVYGYLEKKDLASVLATASEVAENASGDCTEHAVLLAALLRADGIPARVVFGLIYIDAFAGERRIFGYHMWTQAYLGGRFVDLDATLEAPFDAAHISLGSSALEAEASSLALLHNAMQAMSKAKLVVIEPAAKPAP